MLDEMKNLEKHLWIIPLLWKLFTIPHWTSQIKYDSLDGKWTTLEKEKKEKEKGTFWMV